MLVRFSTFHHSCRLKSAFLTPHAQNSSPVSHCRIHEAQFPGGLGAQNDPLASQLLNNATSLGQLDLSKASAQGASASGSSVHPTGSANDLAQQLGRLQLGALDQQVGQTEPTGTSYSGQPVVPGSYSGGQRLPMHMGGQAFSGEAACAMLILKE